MRVRHIVAAAWIATAFGVGGAANLVAQDEWRVRFAAGEQARQAGDHEAYAAEMKAAAEALPEGRLNRPFVQYHAARAAALVGRPDEAVDWLSMAWEEDIEALMISFAEYDPAFAAIRDSDAFREVMGRAERLQLESRPLGGNVHLLTGTGSNLLAQIGPDGTLLVDTGYGPALTALRRALRDLGGDGEVDRLVVTHPHEDHMGSAAELGTTATVYAHSGTSAAMAESYEFMDGVVLPPKAESARPDVVVDEETTIRFNGEEVRLLPTVAHTAGDVSVYFTESNVAHLGDAYLPGNPMMFPGAADPDGFLDRLDAFLDGMNASTVVVGGHEAIADVAAVRAQIEVSRACMAFVRESIEDGLTIEATAEKGMDRFPPQWVAYFYGVFTQG